MKPGAVASRSGSTVAFSWEQEPGVSKQSSPLEARKTSAAAVGTEVDSRKTPASSMETAAAHPHLLLVPPPPGGPGAPVVSPPGRSSRPRSRDVRQGNDPFLAAYLACTDNGSNGGSGNAARELKSGQRLLGCAGLGRLGFSCKSSCQAVEASLVRLAKIPEIDED
ncbi:uncharacterized protein LOC133911193 [Phragmites australis]|uniref:uncharacterized protein LOC133911193 n=1 Tax=Phragmites australis TaxID=29695 RepID=UPI002D771EFE|nr:uncharacterized protein LOC133911193 [Phragmites australis]